MEKRYYNTLINRIMDRSAESTLGVLSVNPPALRRFLTQQFRTSAGESSALLSAPVFQSTFSWETHKKCMTELINDPLHPSLVRAMDMPENEEHPERFPKDRHPYKHQVETWRALSQDQPKSAVITTGTGSGKTECFMVPILNDMAKEIEENGQPLVGVRALFIYPLNALINSQRERLRAWTDDYGDKIRFCLYNGNTPPDIKAAEQRRQPNEVLSREGLRNSPPPLLITNSTMLEYMLIRSVDQPILQKSQKESQQKPEGTLRWIVLDEAHSYIGARAAELSLLLRRVMIGFNVKPKNIRFVATSATIGNDKDAEGALKEYLAGLGGIHPDQVEVIGGKQIKPPLPDAKNKQSDFKTIKAIADDNERYDALAEHQEARAIRQELMDHKGLEAGQIAKKVFKVNNADNRQKVIDWIDVCSRTSRTLSDNTKEPFLPVRGHLFHRVFNGLWACIDPNCRKKEGTALNDPSWRFGRVYTDHRLKCGCEAPIYEVVFCRDCNAAHLQASERGGQIVQSEKQAVDEFSLDIEDAAEDAEDAGDTEDAGDGINNSDNIETSTSETPTIFAQKPSDTTSVMMLGRKDMKLGGECDEDGEGIAVNWLHSKQPVCAACGHKGYKGRPFLPARLGTPFYVSNIVATLLEHCEAQDSGSESLPCGGRRLITFTDSRQGTARIAAKMQQDAERNRLRGLVYELVANNSTGEVDDKERQNLEEDWRNASSSRAKKVLEEELNLLDNPPQITWGEMVEELKSLPDLSKHMRNSYKDMNSDILVDGDVGRLAEILLLREFARRPRRQNSLETLGLVAVGYSGLEKVTDSPIEWQKKGKKTQDWQNFLKLCLDFHVRDRIFIKIKPEWFNWLGTRFFPKLLLPPKSFDKQDAGHKSWPQLREGKPTIRLFRLLAEALNMDIESPEDRVILNELMCDAWEALTKKTQILEKLPVHPHYRLDPQKITFKPIRKAWKCPVTLRVLDTTLCGLTPYLPKKPSSENRDASIITMPLRPKIDDHDGEENLNKIRKWLNTDEHVRTLREDGIWSNLSDQIAEGGMFFRAVEHSAQQPSLRLQDYQDRFKKGQLNVLSCSTTMEMGVDIGGLSIVAMNNAPPHPANYLQRAGRAGRRNETQSVALTVCRDNPHEMAVFKKPNWAFTTPMPKPVVTLNSKRIVQRHINAFILTHFLKQDSIANETETIKLDCHWFFCTEGADISIAEQVQTWLNQMMKNITPTLADGLRAIIDETALKDYRHETLLDKCKQTLATIQKSWLEEHNKLHIEYDKAGGAKDPYKNRLKRDIERLEKEYLITEMAMRGFLPSYGFPINIAHFDPYTAYDRSKNRWREGEREDNFLNARQKPGRTLSMAIREYAPGADIVLNGLVYKSEGLSLNWHLPQGQYHLIETQKIHTAWRCGYCGANGTQSGGIDNLPCTGCGEIINTQSKHTRKFIQPAGFATGFYSAPTNNVSHQHFIPAKDPWIDAGGERKDLPNPDTGSYRCSTEGHIFHHSAGEYGLGYCLCFECGRAESMLPSGAPNMAKKHSRLRGKKNMQSDTPSSNTCEGPSHNFVVQENLHLGHKDSTDMFELYLKDPCKKSYMKKDEYPLCWTLAIALRKTLASADFLGISADDLGFLVKPMKINGGTTLAICLYDTCSGGGGFSSTAPLFLDRLLHKTRDHLACSDNCDSACQYCLLGYDTRDKIDIINRHKALEFLSDDFLHRFRKTRDSLAGLINI